MKIRDRKFKKKKSYQDSNNETEEAEEWNYLDQRKYHKDHDCPKQEGAEEVEIMASPSCPECVQGETDNYHSCQNHRLQNHLSCVAKYISLFQSCIVYTSPVRNSYAKWHGLTCPRKSLNAFDFSDSEGLRFKQSILHTLFSMGPVVLDFFFLANFLILNNVVTYFFNKLIICEFY